MFSLRSRQGIPYQRRQLDPVLHAPFQTLEQGPQAFCKRFESVRHKLKSERQKAKDVRYRRLIFCEAILHIPTHCKGKPVERRGRKATGLRVEAVDHDSGVARMYNTNYRFYVHAAVWPFELARARPLSLWDEARAEIKLSRHVSILK
jgi:hypothetical protein